MRSKEMRCFFLVTSQSAHRESKLESECRRLKPSGMKKDALSSM